jgi:hypothetical protein
MKDGKKDSERWQYDAGTSTVTSLPATVTTYTGKGFFVLLHLLFQIINYSRK